MDNLVDLYYEYTNVTKIWISINCKRTIERSAYVFFREINIYASCEIEIVSLGKFYLRVSQDFFLCFRCLKLFESTDYAMK